MPDKVKFFSYVTLSNTLILDKISIFALYDNRHFFNPKNRLIYYFHENHNVFYNSVSNSNSFMFH